MRRVVTSGKRVVMFSAVMVVVVDILRDEGRGRGRTRRTKGKGERGGRGGERGGRGRRTRRRTREEDEEEDEGPRASIRIVGGCKRTERVSCLAGQANDRYFV